MIGVKALMRRIRCRLAWWNRPSKGPMAGVLLPWESFDDAAMRELLDDISRECGEALDELEQAFRNPN